MQRSRMLGGLTAILLGGLLTAPTPAAAQAATQAAGKPDDPTIVAIFDAANTWDMEAGQLAVSKGASKEVRDFGAMMVRDHGQVRQQGRDLAKRLSVQPTPPKDFALAKDHSEAMTRLRGLRGKAFDRAYLENEVSFHKAVIDAVTSTLLPATQNAELKALEQRVAPAFQAHMQAAQRLLDQQKA